MGIHHLASLINKNQSGADLSSRVNDSRRPTHASALRKLTSRITKKAGSETYLARMGTTHKTIMWHSGASVH